MSQENLRLKNPKPAPHAALPFSLLGEIIFSPRVYCRRELPATWRPVERTLIRPVGAL